MRGLILDLCATRAEAEGTHSENFARLWSSKSPFKAPGRLAQSKHFGSRKQSDKSKRESGSTDQSIDSGMSSFKMNDSLLLLFTDKAKKLSNFMNRRPLTYSKPESKE